MQTYICTCSIRLYFLLLHNKEIYYNVHYIGFDAVSACVVFMPFETCDVGAMCEGEMPNSLTQGSILSSDLCLNIDLSGAVLS